METTAVRYGGDSALVVVDLQNDFVDPRGSLCVDGGAGVVAIANAEIHRALEAGALVAYSQDWHPPHTPHFAQDGGTWPVHCVAGSWGAEFTPGLVVEGPIVRKGTGGEDGYSAFSVREVSSGRTQSTGLAELLAAHDTSAVVLCGLATDYCVKETALDGLRLGYRVSVLQPGVRAVDLRPGDGARAIAAMRAAGAEIR
jgi:nicotinamidase/pyrazinamidase